MVGKSLRELNLTDRLKLTVIAITRRGVVTLNPDDQEVLDEGDELIVAGYDSDLQRLLESW